MLKPEIIAKIKQLQLKAGYLTSNAMVGEYSSAFKGLGQEFDKVREYIPGDDIRSIDWNVTARMNEPYVKVFREEREMTLMLMVDVSPSQRFGTTGAFKQEQAAELAAILAFLAIKNNDKVGLLVFSDHVEEFIRPQKGRAHVWRIIRTVLTHQGSGKKTDIASATNYLINVIRRKSMCFLISDFQAENFEKGIRILGKKHDLTCCITTDPREEKLPDCGLLEVTDPETGERYCLDFSNRKSQEFLKASWQQEKAELVHLFRRMNASHFFINTDESVVNLVIHYLKYRERRLSR